MQEEGKRESKGRASKRKANRAIRNEEQEESEPQYDWEADHEDCDWAAYPAECIIAVTNKNKYVVSATPFCQEPLVFAGLEIVTHAYSYDVWVMCC